MYVMVEICGADWIQVQEAKCQKFHFLLICPIASSLASKAGLDIGTDGWIFYIGVKLPAEGKVSHIGLGCIPCSS